MNHSDNNASLQALYPFLNNTPSNAAVLNHALLDSIDKKIAEHQRVVTAFSSSHAQAMVKCAQAIAGVYNRKGQLFTMGNGGEMAKLQLDHCLIVDSTSIHRVQECHVAIYHVLWDLVHTLLADTRGKINTKETGDEIR